MIKHYFLFILLLISGFLSAQEFELDAPLDWNYQIPANDIVLAGEDFSGRYDSPTEQTIGRIAGGSPFWDPNHPAHQNQCLNNNRCDWVVQVQKMDIQWHPDLQLFIKRNGFLPNVSNGDIWQEVTDIPLDFFNGTGETDDIFVQYSFRNVSVLMDADEYSAQIMFTLVEI